jgi:hypothetical protein
MKKFLTAIYFISLGACFYFGFSGNIIYWTWALSLAIVALCFDYGLFYKEKQRKETVKRHKYYEEQYYEELTKKYNWVIDDIIYGHVKYIFKKYPDASINWRDLSVRWYKDRCSFTKLRIELKFRTSPKPDCEMLNIQSEYYLDMVNKYLISKQIK